MPELSKGIFDPFTKPRSKKKKKNPRMSTLEETNLEEGIFIPPSVTLDGDSYGLIIVGTSKPEKAAKRVVDIIYAVNSEHQDDLNMHGIFVEKPAEEDEVILKAGNKYITVYVEPGTQDEVPLYRRIAHTLLRLPVRDILDHHKTKVYERG